MTNGQLITRLCKIRDDLTETVVQLKDAPVEWVKEEPEGCVFCSGLSLLHGDDDEHNMLMYRRTTYDAGKPETFSVLAINGVRCCFKVNFCPMCGRGLRGT